MDAIEVEFGRRAARRRGWPWSSAAAPASTRSAAPRPPACCARSTASATTSSRSASPTTAAGCSRPTTRRRWELTGGVLPEVKDGDGPGVHGAAGGRRPQRCGARAGPAAARARRGRRRASRCCTGRSARTARSRACSSSPTCATSAPGSRLRGEHGQARDEGGARRRRAAGRAVPRGLAARLGAAPRPGAATDVEELGWPVFVKPARAGSSIGITKVHRPEDLDAAIEAARGHDPKVVVEARRRPRDRVRRAGGAGRRSARRPACRARSRSPAEPRVLRLRGQVPRRGDASG